MDINLTGQVAANLIQNPFMIVSTSAVGGLIAGGLTLLGVWITQKHAAEREQKNRKEEAKRIQREERKKIYLTFLYTAHRLRNLDVQTEQERDELIKPFVKSLVEINILGSPEVIAELKKYPLMPSSILLGNLNKLYPILKKRMSQELQGIDVYKIVDEFEMQ